MNRNARHRRRRQTQRQEHRELQRAAWDVLFTHARLPFSWVADEAERRAAMLRLAALMPPRRPR